MTKTIIAFVFFGLALGLFVMYVKPTYDGTRDMQERLSSYDEALSKTKEIQQLKASLLQQRNTFTNENLDRLHKLLPDHVDNVRLVLDLDGIASKYGIRIQNVGLKNSAAEGSSDVAVLDGGELQNKPYQALTLTFDVVASYEEFMLLLKDLESSLRIVDMTSLSISPSSNIPNAYTFGVALRTYWLP